MRSYRRPCYVVNTHDVLNFDIDFSFTDSELKMLQDQVLSKKYRYVDMCDPFDDNNNVKDGMVHRCRLRGVMSNKNVMRTRDLFQRIILLINSANGYVLCNIIGIDIYKRLLIDIEVYSNGVLINVKDYILQNSKNSYVVYRNGTLDRYRERRRPDGRRSEHGDEHVEPIAGVVSG